MESTRLEEKVIQNGQKITVLEQKVINLIEGIDELKNTVKEYIEAHKKEHEQEREKNDKKYAPFLEFKWVQRIVYGGVGAILYFVLNTYILK